MRALYKAFKEYGAEIKEFQWLAFVYDTTKQTEFPFEEKLDPFVQMGWLHRTGDTVHIEKDGEVLLDKIYGMFEKKPEPPRVTRKRRPDEVKEYLLEILEKPADIHINRKYEYQLKSLVEKFGASLVISVATWYNESRDLLSREYQNLRYEQFMHHGMFQALQKWMTDGVYVKQETDFRNRVC
jgi:hypothetical protein